MKRVLELVFVSLLLLGGARAALAACTCAVTAGAILHERVYDMRTVVDGCQEDTQGDCDGLKLKVAIDTVLDDTNSGAWQASAAKTLYFAPGGDYSTTQTITIDVHGVVLRGDAGDYRWNTTAAYRGTTFRCEVGDNQACIVFDPSGTGYGFVYENIAMTWDSTLPASAPTDASTVSGLKISESRNVVVRDSYWESFPGKNVLVDGGNTNRFVNLKFQSANADSYAAMSFENSVNSSEVDRIHVSGFDYGVRYIGGNEATLRSGVFENTIRDSALYLDSVVQFRVLDSRFEVSSATGPSTEGVIHMTRTVAYGHNPDVVIGNCYFDLGCVADRWPIILTGSTTSAAVQPRVVIQGSLFYRCAEGVVYNDMNYSAWQCFGNKAYQRTQTTPSSVYETYFFGPAECGPDENGDYLTDMPAPFEYCL